MIVILEGPDGGGKTRLAEQLSERYDGLPIEHEGPPPPDVDLLEHYGAKLDNWRGHSVIFDRLALGERFYGPVHRGVDRLGADGWRVFSRLLRAVGAKHVICVPPYAIARNGWKERKGELLTDETAYIRVYNAYAAWHDDQVSVCGYDWTQKDAFEKLCNYLERTELSLPAGFIGSPTARYLFVGDRGARPNGLTPDLPFFSTGNSSGYLNDALQAAGIAERELALVNSWNHGFQGWMPIPKNKFETIVALGSRASHGLRAQGIRHTKIPHPQFWKRFHAHQPKPYVDAIREACFGSIH